MTSPNTAETSESRKRPRDESNDKKETDEQSEKPTPAYGTQEYWENRYKNNANGGKSEKNEDDPEAFHAWYFQFDELAPILLPLIVGSAEYEANEDDNDDPSEVEREKEEASNGVQSETTEKQGTASSFSEDKDDADNTNSDDAEQNDKDLDGSETNDGDGDGDDCSDTGSYEGFEIVEMDEEDDDDADSVAQRVGLAKNGPISVLEVGCGDVPLGLDLALSVQKFGNQTKQDPSQILEKIVCLDYSKSVIQTMKDEQQQSQKSEQSIPLLYEVGDARDLVYKNESFEVILEKGTLDAMLSDSDGLGQTNCRKIVSECGRVLKIGGYFVIISHLNAHVESGMEWLNNVIVPGLRAAGKYEWLIEVHGSDIEIPSDDDDEGEGNEKEIESPGPAVYFIEKVGVLAEKETGASDEQPTIPLKFYNY